MGFFGSFKIVFDDVTDYHPVIKTQPVGFVYSDTTPHVPANTKQFCFETFAFVIQFINYFEHFAELEAKKSYTKKFELSMVIGTDSSTGAP